MKSNFLLTFLAACALTFSGCGKVVEDVAAMAPPGGHVQQVADATLFSVDHPEQFPLVAATVHTAVPELVVTGSVTPDISRNVPVVSLASGRVMAVNARLGDTVQKGQLLFAVRSDDVMGGYSNYRKAIADETLARAQWERAKDLFQHGAMAKADMEVAQDAEEKAKVDLEAMSEHLRLLGNDPDKPAAIVDIPAPVTGVITDQQITNSAAIQAFGTPSPFTISDLSSVWVVCDVYENDLSTVAMGDPAEIRLNAYPNRIFRGKVSNIGSILDPAIRTAKVRIEVANPGMMRIGMFVQATFRGQRSETRTVVPANAIVHIHDRDFVYVADGKKFRRLEVVSGDGLPNGLQEIKSGLAPGQQVVSNALVLEHTIDQ